MSLSGIRMRNFVARPRCDNGHGPSLYATGYGESHILPGNDMIYELYRCIVSGCQAVAGIPTGLRFWDETPQAPVFLDLHGEAPVQIERLDVRRWLEWNGRFWELRVALRDPGVWKEGYQHALR